MIYLFYVLAALLLIQGAVSLLEGIHYRAFVEKEMAADVAQSTRAVTIIAPCKGLDPGFEENIRALFEQDYPAYEIIFVVASADDPANAIIERVVHEHTNSTARLLIAGRAEGRSEKINNLLHAIGYAAPETEVLVFVDSDARAGRDWLRSLVAPLGKLGVGAATGYRWLLPNEKGGFWPALLSAWNGSVATTLGDHNRNFAWGGSTAISVELFDKLEVAQKWKNALSDDYVLTQAVHDAGLRVVFVPRCLLISREDASLRSLLEFTTRQVIITRVYRPRVWWVGFASHLLFNLTFFCGLALAFLHGVRGHRVGAVIAMLTVIYALGAAKGYLRLSAAYCALSEFSAGLYRLWWAYVIMWPFVSTIFLYNFVASAFTRKIRWRGICYELKSTTETVVRP